MMKRIQLSPQLFFTLMLFFLLSGSGVNAQSLVLKSSTVTIHGETNVNHDYTTKATKVSGKMTVVGNSPKSLEVEIPVRSILSGERLMDKKTHETFNESKNPTIRFSMTKLNSLQVNGDDLAVAVTGDLSMAGATKEVTLTAKGKEFSPGVYTFEGSLPLKMTDYNMKPPTAMLGTMKTKDPILVKYQVTFEGPAGQFN